MLAIFPALEQARLTALGKKGRVSALMASLGAMAPEERKGFGQAVNEIKDRVGAALDARKSALEVQALDSRLANEQADVTLPVRLGAVAEGRIHPVSQVFDECVEIFADMGFAVAEGPDIETDDLQLHQAQHPARASRAPGARHVLFPRQARRRARACCARTRARCRSAP